MLSKSAYLPYHPLSNSAGISTASTTSSSSTTPAAGQPPNSISRAGPSTFNDLQGTTAEEWRRATAGNGVDAGGTLDLGGDSSGFGGFSVDGKEGSKGFGMAGLEGMGMGMGAGMKGTQPYPYAVAPQFPPMPGELSSSPPRRHSDRVYNPTTAAAGPSTLRRYSDRTPVRTEPYPAARNRPSASGSGGASANPSSESVAKSGRAGNKRKQKFTRTRTGCMCCRSRRIKCDEGRPVCKRCIIAKRECVYADDTPAKDGRSRSSSEESGVSPEPQKVVHPPGGNITQIVSPEETMGLEDIYNTHTLDKTSSTNGLVQAEDFNWDESFVGGYDSLPFGSITEIDGMGNGNGNGTNGNTLAVDLAGKHQNWGMQGGVPMWSTPNFLLPWFPSAEERSLILHYCANAADLMMAIPSGINPMLAINLPLALDFPRGMDPSADALRVTLLGIGAVHQAFLLARSGVANSQTAAMFQYASNLRDTGKEMVRKAALEGGGAASDAALGAATALATVDIFFGGGGWRQNFDLAKNMVAFRGGPAEMLKASQPKMLQDGVSISPARLQLEILAIYEVLASLATGEEPTLISDKWENWWFEGSRSTYEEHSVEKQFGMSRVMVHLLSRVTRLISKVSRTSSIVTETDDALLSVSAGPSRHNSMSPTAVGSARADVDEGLQSVLASAASIFPDPLVAEARKLNADVDAWIDSLKLTTLEHERVQVGNRAYAHAMKILLLRNVFRYPREDIRVQNAAMEVLKHCSTSTALLGMSIDLTWPAIIAGCCVDGPSRQWLLTLLEGFKSQCCFDIDTAATIIAEVWRRVDGNLPGADWKRVCDDLGLQVLLC